MKWAEVATAYAEDEFAGLRRLAAIPENMPYVLGMLEDLKSPDAIDAVLEFFRSLISNPSQDMKGATEVARRAGLLLGDIEKDGIQVTKQQADLLRPFFRSVYELSEEAHRKLIAMYPMRYVGDHSTLEFLRNTADLPAPWQKERKQTIAALRKRIEG